MSHGGSASDCPSCILCTVACLKSPAFLGELYCVRPSCCKDGCGLGPVARVPMARSRRDGRHGDASFSGGKAITFSHNDHVMSMSHHDTRAFTAMAVWAQIDSCHVACHCPCCLSSAGNSFMQVRSPSLHGMRGRQADQFRIQWSGSARLHHRR